MLVVFTAELERRRETSSDVFWSLRWKTQRNGALDNKLVQPLLPNCRSTQVANRNQKQTVLCAGRNFSAVWEEIWLLFVHGWGKHGNSGSLLTNTLMQCHPWPVFHSPRCLMSSLRLSAKINSNLPCIYNLLPPSSCHGIQYVNLKTAFVNISPRFSCSHSQMTRGNIANYCQIWRSAHAQTAMQMF